MLFRHLCIVLGAMSLQVFLPFSNSIVFVLLSFENSLYILDISPLSNFFLLVCGLSFHPLTRVFFRTKDFNFSCCCYLVVKLCPTLWDPMYCSPPGSSVHGISRQEYWSGCPFISPGNLANSMIESRSPALQEDSLQSEPPCCCYC